MKVRPRTKGRSRNYAYQQRHRVAFAQQHAESVAWMCPAWMCPECLDTSPCHPATSMSECPQLHLRTPWGSRRRKRLEWKKVGIKRKWNWALKWKGRQATVIRVSFHSTLNLQGWDQRLSSSAAESSPAPHPRLLAPRFFSVLL